ncbi:hypothetical protein [Paraglaciecola aestuariivivens]
MKTRILTTVLLTATLSMSASASMKNSNKFKFVGDTEYAGLCKAAATNDLHKFKINLKQQSFRLNTNQGQLLSWLANADSFQCAGQGIVAFAQQRGSTDVANYITGENANVEVASSKQYRFVGDNGFKNFCKSALTNSVSLFKLALNKQIGNLGMSKKDVLNKVLEADNVTCNGKALGEFFEQQKASSVLGYIAENQ